MSEIEFEKSLGGAYNYSDYPSHKTANEMCSVKNCQVNNSL